MAYRKLISGGAARGGADHRDPVDGKRVQKGGKGVRLGFRGFAGIQGGAQKAGTGPCQAPEPFVHEIAEVCYGAVEIAGAAVHEGQNRSGITDDSVFHGAGRCVRHRAFSIELACPAVKPVGIVEIACILSNGRRVQVIGHSDSVPMVER